MAKYAADLIATPDMLRNAGSYWRLKWFEKLVVSLVLKLKLK
jgi:hypothetical protein